MIISASRRTDLPAFYSTWFINRIRAGFCTVPNPFNPSQVSRISLLPQDIDVIVFWTRHAAPLLPRLPELDSLGYRYYFQYTLIGNPPEIDPHAPVPELSTPAFRKLSESIGPHRIIWRYDPVVFSALTPAEFHHDNFTRLARSLRGYTSRCVISLLDIYPKLKKSLREMSEAGAPLLSFSASDPWFAGLMRHFSSVARENNMQIFSCAETIDLSPFGILPGKCIDDGYILDTFGLDVTHAKDPSQRPACGCVLSKDIGMYDSCLFGCRYCYATRSLDRARLNHSLHDPSSLSLLPSSSPTSSL